MRGRCLGYCKLTASLEEENVSVIMVVQVFLPVPVGRTLLQWWCGFFLAVLLTLLPVL